MDVKQFLSDQHVNYETTPHTKVFTAQEVAAVEHVPGDEVAKPVIVELEDGSAAMVVCPASYRVDLGRVSEELHQTVRLAPEQDLRKLIEDVEVGAEPPFGSLYGLPTIADKSLALQRRITFRGGSHTETITIDWSDYERVEQPRVAEVARHL